MLKQNQDAFIKIFENIKREGAAELLQYICKTDFFTAPASAKFHSAFEGGLCSHSVNTYTRLDRLVKSEYGEDWQAKFSGESIAICGLLHDLCKIEYYKTDYKNNKVNGEWVKTPYYAVDEKLPYGHGEKSVYIINGFIRLSREEALAINWHMGGFDYRAKGGNQSVSEAFDKFNLCLMLHIADLQATYIDEHR
jgi:hypothetical protein